MLVKNLMLQKIISLYKEASKVFTANELLEFGFSDDIEKVQTKY